MSTVALAGDWHGNTRWAIARIAEVAECGVALILHLGGTVKGSTGIMRACDGEGISTPCAERRS